MKAGYQAGIFLAVLAAALYALNAPLSKLLLDFMPSTLMAGFLYLGAGLGWESSHWEESSSAAQQRRAASRKRSFLLRLR